MEKVNKFFMTTLVAGLVAFSAVLVIPTQMAQALIGTNQIADNAITSPKIRDGEVKTPDLATAAVTKEKLNPSAVKLVVIEREKVFTVEPNSQTNNFVNCNPDEIVIGGGFENALVDSSNKGINGWHIRVLNDRDAPREVRITAQCAHLELGP